MKFAQTLEERKDIGSKPRWPAKPDDRPAAEPEDVSVVKLLAQYECESFRVNDGWAVVHEDNSTVIMFHTPLSEWEPILKKLCGTL